MTGNTFSGWTTNISGDAQCEGTVNGNTFTLTANCDTTAPLTVPDGVTLDGGGHTITAHDPSGGFFKGGVVTNAVAGDTMTVQNLTVSGPAGGFGTDCAQPLTGIFFNDASGSVNNVTVKDITQHSACQLGLGIRANGISGARTVTLNNVTVTGYQKGGLVASGSMTMNVSNSKVGPPDNTAARPAQNGVQYSNTASGSNASAGGSVTNTTVDGLYYPGDNSSTDFLLYGAANVTLEHDTITGNGTQVGVSVDSNSTGIALTENMIGVTPAGGVSTTGVSVDDSSSAVLTCNTFNGWDTNLDGTMQAPCESGAIKITKTSNSTPPLPLAGAGFSITGQGLATAATLTTTGTDGTACVDGLLYGDYMVTETAPPPGYQPSTPNTQTVTVSTDGDCQGYGTPATVTFTNAPRPESGAIKIIKLSSTTPPMPLAGAGFSITGQGLATVTPTGPDGTACVDGLLYGTYTVTETGPPPGYELGAPSTKTLTVTSDGDCQGGGTPATLTFGNPPVTCLTPVASMTPAFTAVPPATLPATSTSTPLATETGQPTATSTPPSGGGAPGATSTPIPPSGGGGAPGATATPIPPSGGGGAPGATATPIPPSGANGGGTGGGVGPNATATLTATPGVGAPGGARPNATATPTTTPVETGTTTPAQGVPRAVTSTNPTATPTSTSSAPPPASGGVPIVPVPTPGAHSPNEAVVLAVTTSHLEQRESGQQPAPAQVPHPPVQLPPVADGIYDLVTTAFTGAQQPIVETDPCALPEISMTSSANPGTALVGEPVSFTYTVKNDGTVPLTDLQIGSALPSGLTFVSASSQGAVNGDTGYVEWALDGLAPEASTQLSVSASIASPGEWANDACSVGQDEIGNEAKDCASATVVGMLPTMTTTPTRTATVTTVTPQVALPIATPPPSVSADCHATGGRVATDRYATTECFTADRYATTECFAAHRHAASPGGVTAHCDAATGTCAAHRDISARASAPARPATGAPARPATGAPARPATGASTSAATSAGGRTRATTTVGTRPCSHTGTRPGGVTRWARDRSVILANHEKLRGRRSPRGLRSAL